LEFLFPTSVTTAERVGRAMLSVAEHGAPTRLLENNDTDALARQPETA
jgi:hypothetical protein